MGLGIRRCDCRKSDAFRDYTRRSFDELDINHILNLRISDSFKLLLLYLVLIREPRVINPEIGYFQPSPHLARRLLRWFPGDRQRRGLHLGGGKCAQGPLQSGLVQCDHPRDRPISLRGCTASCSPARPPQSWCTARQRQRRTGTCRPGPSPGLPSRGRRIPAGEKHAS